MSNDLSVIVGLFSEIIQNEPLVNIQTIDSICGFLSKQIYSKVILIDYKGELLFGDSLFPEKKHIETQYNQQLNKIIHPMENISYDYMESMRLFDRLDKNEFYTILPLVVSNQRRGTLICCKEGFFTADNLIVLKLSTTILALVCGYMQDIGDIEKSRTLSLVKSAIGLLSYTELEAVLLIFEELNGNSGLVVASKIADENNITRSVIVNALRKLESAGVLETRSLGMKGTHIKILTETLICELSKLKS